MKVEPLSDDVLRITGARPELTALVAAARMAHRLLEEDPAAPPEARAILGRVLADWDAALGKLDPG